MDNRHQGESIIGILFLGIGLFMLSKSIYVSNFGFWRIGYIDTGGILIVLLVLSMIGFVLRPGKLTRCCIIIILIMLFVSVLLSTHIYLRHISLIDIILILCPIGVGAGLLIRGMIGDRRGR